MVVAVALLAADDDLIGPAVGIWQALHLCQVQAGETSGGAKRQAGGSAGGHVARLGAGHLADDGAGRPLQLV